MSKLHILVQKRAHTCIGQVLDYDIAAEGATMAEMFRNLQTTIADHIEWDREQHRKPLQDVPKAPAYLWKIWREQAKAMNAPRPVAQAGGRAMAQAMKSVASAECHLANP